MLNLGTMDHQISLFPRINTAIYLADAAAIKVRNTLPRIRHISILYSSGGDKFSC
jgi:hypothetical protein